MYLKISNDDIFYPVITCCISEMGVQSIYDITETQFWNILKKLHIRSIEKSHCTKRTLKIKIIIINRLLSNKYEEINIESLYYNAVKKEWRYNKNLKLQDILNFKFINKEEKLLVDNIIINKERR